MHTCLLTSLEGLSVGTGTGTGTGCWSCSLSPTCPTGAVMSQESRNMMSGVMLYVDGMISY